MRTMTTIGSDPEILFANADGKFMSAIRYLIGTKEEPTKVGNNLLHYDNVTAEFSIPPATSCEIFSQSINDMLLHIQQIADANAITITQNSFGTFEPEELENIYARIAGCSPDFNAWTGMVNEPPDYNATADRAAGGHVHIGVDGLTDEQKSHLVQVLDLYVTMPMMRHEDPKRRQLYGKAGAYRPKEYGLEYRTPSNIWIFTPARREWMYEAVSQAVSNFEAIEPDPVWQFMIDYHDVGAVEEICQERQITLCP